MAAECAILIILANNHVVYSCYLPIMVKHIDKIVELQLIFVTYLLPHLLVNVLF